MPWGFAAGNPFTNPRPMQASQNFNNGLQNNMYAPHGGGHGRSRSMAAIPSSGGILPTPDPTVGSCVSEEDKDVALQLMRLGDMSNISHGRTSASTLDETFSGKADAASSTGATSDGGCDSDEELPAARRQKLEASAADRNPYQITDARLAPAVGATEFGADEPGYQNGTPMNGPNAQSKSSKSAPKAKSTSSKPKAAKNSKSQPVAKKLPPVPGGPMSPVSAPDSRKQSIADVNGTVSQPGGGGADDQPDLSTKPRCQRCRKSKKGCDRQRPCGRCRDAGLTAEQCISEDEGNGRKGRYGRHMGVPIKKDENHPTAVSQQPALLPAAPIAVAASSSADKAKKRKR